MPETVSLIAADGHTFSAYRAGPDDAPHALVVVQEIFGVNPHMRRVCDRFAAEGYRVLCPALFDRVNPGIELGYAPADIDHARALRGQIGDDAVLCDIEAAAAALGTGPRGIVGYCWGGSVAWWGATRTSLFQAAIGWYGGGIASNRDETPNCPVQLHFGEADAGIPMDDVELIRRSQPTVAVFTYPGAGHGFGCDDRDSFDPGATAEAHARTLEFLRTNL